jgi:hypothetical protein
VLDLGGSVSQNPSAGVTFDQTASDADSSDASSNAAVTVQIVSMENADSVGLQFTNADTGDTNSPSGSFSGQTAGSTADVTNLESDDTITVTATLDGKTSVIQTYTVD